MKSVRPIRPDEVVARKAELVPGEVYEAFNELIAERWNGSRAVVMQGDVLKRVLAKLSATKPEIDRAAVLSLGWLDVEDAYRAVGWDVEYAKPAYNEAGPAVFKFSKNTRDL